MDDETRPKRGIVVSLQDQGDGQSDLIIDDVRSKGASTWMFDACFTQKIFDNGCLDSMALSDDDYREIGIAVIARLLAVNGRTK